MAAGLRLWLPRGEPPSRGWPVLLFLHGCGGDGGEHARHAAAAAARGLAAAAPPGPVGALGGGRAWPAVGFGATHEYLRQMLDLCGARARVDRSRTFLCGLSQGATHVVGLLATRPEEYSGGMALSPGDGPAIPEPAGSACGAPALYVGYGAREYPAFRKKARRCAGLWRRAGWPWRLEAHAGGHHMPADWDARFPDIAAWLEGRCSGR